jgi:hypothetical protein
MGKEYEGTFSVKNATGEKIYMVEVIHHAGSILGHLRQRGSLEAKSLENGASIQGGCLFTAAGVHDLWDVKFSVDRPAWGGGGQMVMVRYVRLNKGCDYEPEDAPQNCEIELKIGSFSVKMPVSSSCLDNYIHTE